MTLGELLKTDLARFQTQSADHRAAGDTLRSRVGAILSSQLQCVVLYRLSHWLWVRNWRRTARSAAAVNTLVYKLAIAPDSSIGPGLFLPHPPGTSFCGHAGAGFTMYSLAVCCPLASDGWRADRGPRLGDNVTIGAHSVIQGPLQVGDRVKVAYAVPLDRSVPDGALVISKTMRLTKTVLGRAG